VVDFKLSFFCRLDSAGDLAVDLEAKPSRELEVFYLVVYAW